MKLVAEQIKYLRARKKELEGKRQDYIRYCQNRESAGVEGIGLPHFLDFQEDMEIANMRNELHDIDKLLGKAEFVSERNLDSIDIGTRFTLDFGDGELDDTMLIERGTTCLGNRIYASTESDLGKVIIGKKEGEAVTYVVTATGRSITATVQQIDRMKEHYEHFIREEEFTDRVSNTVSNELRQLKEENPEEYRRRHAMTPSQERLLIEELDKINPRSNTPKDVSRRGHINRLLRDCIITPIPTGDTVQIGSIVEFMIQDESGETKTYKMEMINRAVSTEIASDYLERITPLGNAIFGHKAGETFSVRRNHKPALKGAVISVENFNEKERVL